MIKKISILVIVLLFVSVEGWWSCKKIGSGTLTNSSVFGRKRDFYYDVPSGTQKVSFDKRAYGEHELTYWSWML